MTISFSFEKKFWKKGFGYIAGVDEVGRGSFAGPLVAGCVVFDKSIVKIFKNNSVPRIDDSKKLTARQRETAAKWIKLNAVSWGTGEASVSKINKLGMTKTTGIAFRQAISRVNLKLTANGQNTIDFF